MKRMWIADDADGVPTLWTEGDNGRPVPLLDKPRVYATWAPRSLGWTEICRHRDLVWDLIVRAVEREWPDPHIYIWNPRYVGIRAGYRDDSDPIGDGRWWWRCRYPVIDKTCQTNISPTQPEALGDAYRHLAEVHGVTR